MNKPLDRLNYDVKARSRASALSGFEPSRTQQHMADECNINTIVKRFGLTGTLPQAAKLPTYGDFTGLYDYQTALNALQEANEVFDSLPADIRKRFENNPAMFVDFCSNSDNLDELREMGLAKPAPVVSVPQEPMQPGSEPAAGGGAQ